MMIVQIIWSDELESLLEVVEVAPLVHQVCEGTAFNDGSGMEHHNFVRVLDGIQSVSNRNTGFSFHESVQRLLNLLLI